VPGDLHPTSRNRVIQVFVQLPQWPALEVDSVLHDRLVGFVVVLILGFVGRRLGLVSNVVHWSTLLEIVRKDNQLLFSLLHLLLVVEAVVLLRVEVVLMAVVVVRVRHPVQQFIRELRLLPPHVLTL
jgi:hypothetical protein